VRFLRFANFAKLRSLDGIGGQAHIDDVEDVEKLGAELHIEKFAACGTLPTGVSLIKEKSKS
jgi:hypothetical protein